MGQKSHSQQSAAGGSQAPDAGEGVSEGSLVHVSGDATLSEALWRGSHLGPFDVKSGHLLEDVLNKLIPEPLTHRVPRGSY